MSGGEQRPGDAARRALRAARERGAESGADEGSPAAVRPEGPASSEAPGAGTPAERETRPGDAARLALRAAAAAKEAQQADAEPDSDAGGADVGAATDAGAAAVPGAGLTDAGAPAPAAGGPGARPGDVAREALRAARAEARRAEAAAAEASETPPGRAARRLPSAPPAEAARGHTARELRQFLATAFQMPREEPETDQPTQADAPADQGTSAERLDEDRPHLTASRRSETDPTPAVALSRPQPTAPGPAVVPDRPERTAFAFPASPGRRESTAPASAAFPDRPERTAFAFPASPGRRESTAPASAVVPGHPEPTASAFPAPGHPESTAPIPDRPEPSAPGPALAPGGWEPTAPAPATTPDQPEPIAPAAPNTDSGHPGPAATAATPRLPRTMATPHRDTELRRTFPSFPSRAGASGPDFAETWWGNAWVRALEEGALDVKRLARGRNYAERGHVDAITVTPGLVLAYVQGSRPRPYRVQVRLRTFGGDEWERFLEAAADRPGDIAALLDKELPQALADSGIPLLPGPGELEPRCSCPDFGHPCKHAAALCYQTARLLDADPFVLLLLRGRGEREVIDALSRRNAARAARERQPASLPGVRATEALVPRRLPPLPPPLPVPPHPEQPPVYPGVPGGPDPFTLDQLATDAAARAHALLATGRDPVGELTLWQDAVRLAAARPGSGLTASTRAVYASLADAVGRTPGDLARAVAAWRQGGPEGLAVLEEPWDPPAGRFDRARPLLLAADLPAFRPWRNHLTHPREHVQLRLGRDGLWYAYESEPGHDDWWPRGTPDLDPVGALTGLGTADDLQG